MDRQQKPSPNLHVVAQGVTSSGEPITLYAVAILLHSNDDVAIARVPLSRGVVLRLPATGALVEVTQRIQSGHKIALHAIAQP